MPAPECGESRYGEEKSEVPMASMPMASSMSAELGLFYFFASLALVSGGMVIRAKNPVHSVLFLILVFCNSAGVLLLLDLDFFAMLFLVVYVGAVAVLFLFVVMMLNVKLAAMRETALRYLPVGGLLGLLFLLEVLLVIQEDFIPFLPVLPGTPGEPVPWTHWATQVDWQDTLTSLGQRLYTLYSLQVLLASALLLVAMLGAIALTLHRRPSGKEQRVFAQNARDFAKTLRRVRWTRSPVAQR